MATDPVPKSSQQLAKLRIIKNLVLISISFFLLFTAYDGLSMLQSTMNKKDGVGVISQAVAYISFCISALLLPKYVIKKLGCKSSLILSISFYLPYIAANFYPQFYIMIPAGIFCGIGASVLWGSQCTYFNESAVRYAKLIADESTNSNQSPDAPSNCTSVEILSVRNSKSETFEEIPLHDDPSLKIKLEVTNVESNVKKYKCKNPKCGNVDEFFVSEIEKSCVKYLGNKAENNDMRQLKEERKSSLPTNVTSSSVQTHENIEKVNKEDLQDSAKISNLEDINVSEDIEHTDGSMNKGTTNLNEKSLSPEVNPEHKSVFQKASTLESVTSLFFGCHGIAFYSAQICSNGISYYILKWDETPGSSYFGGCSCGADFCNNNPWCVNENTEDVSQRVRYLLTGVCLAIASISVLLISTFVDPLKKAKAEGEPEKITLRLVSATIEHNKKKEQLCLIPLSFFEGMQQGFYTADFTKSYVACAWGASNVGLVSVFYGSACVISTSASGLLVRYVGRKPLFLTGQVLSLSMMIFLMLWKPDAGSPYKFFIGGTFFGTITGIYWSQLLAFHGLLFKKDEEAAFASYYLWSSLGWTASFLYSDHLCTSVKIYLLFACSITGTTGYFFTERSYGLRKTQEAVATT